MLAGVSDPSGMGHVLLQELCHHSSQSTPLALQSGDDSREIHEAPLSVCMSVLSVFLWESLLGSGLGESEVIIGRRALLPSAPS